jgi:hypothetical protein
MSQKDIPTPGKKLMMKIYITQEGEPIVESAIADKQFALNLLADSIKIVGVPTKIVQLVKDPGAFGRGLKRCLGRK